MEDCTNPVLGFLLPAATGVAPPDESKGDEYVANNWGKFIPVIEARLAEHGKPFIAGTDRPTIADFKAFGCFALSGTDINPASIMPESVKAKVMARIAQSAAY